VSYPGPSTCQIDSGN